MPVIVLDVKRGAGRAVADRVIIGELAVAAEAAVVVKLSAAAQANKTSFVFMIFDLSNDWTPRQRRKLPIKTMARVTPPLPCPRTYRQALPALFKPRPALVAKTKLSGKQSCDRPRAARVAPTLAGGSSIGCWPFALNDSFNAGKSFASS